MTSLVWLALDGVGHPADAPAGSVWEQDLPTLRPLIDAGLALDATLGVPGLPQSGTGQACWLTGTDAVALMGEHFGPHPGPTLQGLLARQSLPVRLARAGAHLALANFYAPPYVQHLASPRGGRNRMGCFPFAFQSAALPLNPPDVPLVRASLGLRYDSPWLSVTPLAEVSSTGTALARQARSLDLVVVDLWFSDLLGHQGRWPVPPEALEAGRIWLRRVDALLEALVQAGARVALSSDHGNLEDLRVKAHTLARVPFAAAGLSLGQPEGERGSVIQGGQRLATWLGLEPGGEPDPGPAHTDSD